jgi:hypothetical protein
MNNKISITLAALLMLAAVVQADDVWTNILTENFETDPAARGWSYSGVTNSGGADLFAPSDGQLGAEWDQLNYTDATFNEEQFVTEVSTIENSRFSRPLGQTLTDADRFRFGATLTLTSQAQTSEFHQIASFGLYDLANSGPDRTFLSGGSIPQAKDFVEFNYFITNDQTWALGRNVQPTLAAEGGMYVAGNAADASYPARHFPSLLPEGQELFIEVEYDPYLRRAYAAIYTDAARTTLLEVDGVAVEYWTNQLPAGEAFSVSDVAFFNYAGYGWGGAPSVPATGSGLYDDLYVATAPVPEPLTVSMLLLGGAALLRRRR